MSDQSYKKKRYRKPKEELFLHYKKIIILLHSRKVKDYDHNQIFEELRKESKEDKKQTGLAYKQNTLDSINALKKIGLIEKEKKGKQKIFVKLTPSGIETAEMIIESQNYLTSYAKLVSSYNDKLLLREEKRPYPIKDYLPFIDKRIIQKDFPSTPQIEEITMDLRMTILEKGWKKEELAFYNEIKANLMDLKIVCEKNYFFVLSRRFAKIVKENEQVGPLLLKFFSYIIMEHTEKMMKVILNNFDENIFGFLIERAEDRSPKTTMSGSASVGGPFHLFQELYDIFYNKVISFAFKEEIVSMVKSYLDFTRAPIGNVDISHIDKLKESMTNLKTIEFSKSKREDPSKIKILLDSMELFYATLISYAKKKNIQVVSFY